jgi:hypothetical protein
VQSHIECWNKQNDIVDCSQYSETKSAILKVMEFVRTKNYYEHSVLFVNDGDVLIKENLKKAFEIADFMIDTVLLSTQVYVDVAGYYNMLTCSELSSFENGLTVDEFLIANADKKLHVTISGAIVPSSILIKLEPILKILNTKNCIDSLMVAPPSAKRIFQFTFPLIYVHTNTYQVIKKIIWKTILLTT